MAELVIPAADPRFSYTDYQNLLQNGQRIGFSRTIPNDKKYNLDSPGARMRFRCNAETIVIGLLYKERFNPQRSQNSAGTWFIDGKSSDRWNFERSKRDGRKNESVSVRLPADGKMHTYELILPYGDIVEIHSAAVDSSAVFEKPEPRPPVRCVFYGDSITQGFCASRIDRTFPFLTGELLDYEVINMGIAGIGLNPGTAKVLGGIGMDRLIVEIGANDWKEGMLPEEFRKNVEKFLHDFRSFQPETPVWWITPPWISPKWKVKTMRYELDIYREIIHREIEKRNDPHLHVIDGLGLIDHDIRFYDRVPVHPVDSGYEQMAERLAEQLA